MSKQIADDKTLLDRFLRWQRKIRPALVVMILILVGFAALIEDPKAKVGILISLGITIIFIINDVISYITARMAKFESALNDLRRPKPMEFKDFYVARGELLDVILGEAKERKEISIKIMALAGYYSVEFLVRHIPDILQVAKKVKIEVAVTCEKVLISHHQEEWRHKLLQTKLRMQNIRDDFADEIERGRLSVSLFEYDNLPHWHGILIDDSIFFMGRTEWNFARRNYPTLQLGQIEYRLFRVADPHGGSERIDRFIKWFDYYRLRSAELLQESEQPQI